MHRRARAARNPRAHTRARTFRSWPTLAPCQRAWACAWLGGSFRPRLFFGARFPRPRSRNGSTKSRIRKPKLGGRLFSGENHRSHNRCACQSRSWLCLPRVWRCCCCCCCHRHRRPCCDMPIPHSRALPPKCTCSMLCTCCSCRSLELDNINRCAVLVAAAAVAVLSLLCCPPLPPITPAHAHPAHQPRAVAGMESPSV